MPKTKKQLSGNEGEYQAREFLHHKGYHILKENWRFGKAEVDIICKKEETTVILVEVKRRKNNGKGYPEDFVSNKQLNLLRYAGAAFQERNPEFKFIQIDIIAITDEGPESGLEHFEDV